MRQPLDVMELRGHGDADSGISNTMGSDRFFAHRTAKKHQGWDLLAPVGTPIYAVDAGEVVETGTWHGYGLCTYLQIDLQGRPLWVLYAHLSRAYGAASVLEGAVLGMTGRSGNAGNTPPHLHFEVHDRKHPPRGMVGRVDPSVLLGGRLLTCQR